MLRADGDAEYKRRVMQADGALAQKLDAEIRIHSLWADAFARRQVPATVFGAGGAAGSDVPVGSDSEARTFMQLLTLDAAKRLSYERETAPGQKTASR